MNGKELLKGLSDLSPEFYEEAEKGTMSKMTTQRRTRTFKGTVGKILIAAAILSALTVTASAAGLGWFQRYFESRSDAPLSQAEMDFIAENEQPIYESQTQDGYTLTVKSAITDGRMAYITIGITGPEDAVLTKTTIPGYSEERPNIHAGNWGMGFFEPASGEMMLGDMGLGVQEDYDGRDNTQNWLLTVARTTESGEMAFAPGSQWKLHVEDLIATYYNEKFAKELEEKYKGQENCYYTPEEGEKLIPEKILAKGVWDLDITFEASDTRTIEFIREPVATQACIGWREDGTDVYENVNITSFSLGALSATILISDQDFAPEFNNYADEKFVCAVMKDGSQVRLQMGSGGPGEQHLEAERPIMLDYVDHILMPDGTKLPMP